MKPLAIRLAAGETYRVEVDSEDLDGDALRFVWDVRPEVEPAPYAGIGEEPAAALGDRVVGPNGPRVRFRAPETSGPYRVFVAVYDDRGHVAFANQPFYAE